MGGEEKEHEVCSGLERVKSSSPAFHSSDETKVVRDFWCLIGSPWLRSASLWRWCSHTSFASFVTAASCNYGWKKNGVQ